jgi:hypothetical protein
MKAKDIIGPIYDRIGCVFDLTDCCFCSLGDEPEEQTYYLASGNDTIWAIGYDDEVAIENGMLILKNEDEKIEIELLQTSIIDLSKL